jgi:hypothetical protein
LKHLQLLAAREKGKTNTRARHETIKTNARSCRETTQTKALPRREMPKPLCNITWPNVEQGEESK